MNTRLGKSFGLAFMVAVGILAVMFALGTFSSQQVGADSSGDLHNDVRTVQSPGDEDALQLSSRAASAAVEISIPATAAGLGFAEPVRVRMKGFGLPTSISASDVVLRAGDNAASAGSVLVSGSVIIIEVGDMNAATEANEGVVDGAFTIVIRQAAGITNPAIAGVYHVEVDADGDVSTELDDGGADTHHVRIDRSRKLSGTSGVSGSTVTVSGTGYSSDISAIYIEENLGLSKVTYIWSGGTQAEFTEARGDRDQRETQTDAIDEELSAADAFLAALGLVEVEVTNGAVTQESVRPASDAVYAVVFSNYQVEFWKYTAPVEAVELAEQPPIVAAVAMLEDSPLVVGQDSDDEVIGAQPNVGSDGKFSQTVTVGNKFNAGPNPIFIQDTTGVIEFVGSYNVNASISLDKDAAQLGEQFYITFNHFTQVAPVKVSIGGKELLNDDDTAVIGGITRDAPGNKKRVTVPNEGLESGAHQVKVEVDTGDNKQTATKNIIIGGLPLEFDPAIAVPGQQIIIKGKGFTAGASIALIEIGRDQVTGGNRVPAYDVRSSGSFETLLNNDLVSKGNVTRIVVNNNGDWTGSVKIPERVASVGSSVQVRVREGQGNNRSAVRDITIATPTVTLNPTSGRPGSTLTIKGTGFTAEGTILISYDGQIVTSVNADTVGHFEEQSVVPIDADVGVTEIPVLAEIAIPSEGPNSVWAPKSATALHEVPPGVLSVSPEGGPPGTAITITGEGFKAFTPFTATIGGLSVLSETGVNTDVDGNFSRVVVVPPLREGIHSIVVEQQGRAGSTNRDTISFEVGDIGPATRPSADAFADLVAADNLIVVWYFDNDTKGWSFYDPRPEVAAAVDLTMVTSGDNVWIQITADQMFQGKPLTAGWNLHTLQ